MLRRLTGLLLIVMLVGSGGCSQENEYKSHFDIPEENRNETRFTIKFGRVPSVTVTELLKQNAPLIRRLKQELNVNITYRFAEDYRGIIDGMSRNEYDIAWMGPYSYVLSGCYSDTSAAYRPLVRPVRRNTNGELSAEYRAIIFRNRNADIRSLRDLKGKRFAFVDRRSTSGFLFPMAQLMDAGLNPSTDLEYSFLDRHDRVVQAVDSGEYDAGATYNDARAEEFNSSNRAERRLPIVDQTKPIPSSPIVVSAPFAQEYPRVVEKFIDIMVSLHETGEGQSILQSLKIARYTEARDEHYDEVRNVVRKLSSQLTDVSDFCTKQL